MSSAPSSRSPDLESMLDFTRRLRSLVLKGNWPQPDSKSFAQLLCDEVIGIFETRPPDLDQSLKLMRDLQTVVSAGSWSDESSKPYAELLCDHIIVMFNSVSDRRDDETERVLESHGEIDPSKREGIVKEEKEIERDSGNQSDNRNDQKIFRSKLMVTKREIKNEAYPSISSSSRVDEPKRLARRHRSTMTRRVVITKEVTDDDAKCTGDDGFKWRCYGRKNIRNEKYPRNYYRCAEYKCTAKKYVQRIDDFHIEIIYYNDHDCKHQGQGFIEQDVEEITWKEFLNENQQTQVKKTNLEFPQQPDLNPMEQKQEPQGERMKQNVGPDHCIHRDL